MSNYLEFEAGLKFLYKEIIPGYQLYAMKEYPYAVKTSIPSDLITVEVFKVKNPSTERSIHSLELGVGYYYDEVIIRNNAVGIYLYKKIGNETLVKSGDWVQFFRS
jgi:gamma-glutamylcyclotransferase (GGCT)/AIG2-like uncharacterized protein YtfP